MLIKVRVLLLGLLALTLAGSIVAMPAAAEPGPYIQDRETTETAAEEIAEAAPAQVSGSGGEQRLSVTIGTEAVEITSKAVQVKGIIYDTKLQGQAKLELKYNEPTLVKPALKGCTVTIGTNNSVSVFGHLAWKWNGEKAQLQGKDQPAQRPDWLLLPTNLKEGATELPKGEYSKVTFKGSSCGVFAGSSFKLEGSQSAQIIPEFDEEWGTKQALVSLGGKAKQHFWNGKESIGVETGLTLDANPASLTGEASLEAGGQELDVAQLSNQFVSRKGMQVTEESEAEETALTFENTETVQCPGAKYRIEMFTGPSTVLPVKPIFAATAVCKVGAVTVTITIGNTCQFRMTNLRGGGGVYAGAFEIFRAVGAAICEVKILKTGGCERIVKPQIAIWMNFQEPGGTELLTKFDLEPISNVIPMVRGLEYTANAMCGGEAAGNHRDGIWTGTARFPKIKIELR